MRIKKKMLLMLVVFIVAGGGFAWFRMSRQHPSDEVMKIITPKRGTIKTYFSCTATVLPKNRLEIKPPVNGRIDRILVAEGERVKSGQILAWMSSTERAALLDAARGKDEQLVKYWEDAYKPIPLLSPIDGEVIVAKTQPGQTVTTSDAVVVLSDRLIVRAQVDETDIGKVSQDMKALITLDAFPDAKIKATVGHIYYESKTVNNVTIYEVDLLADEVPTFFRSGMNANVDFIEQEKDSILLIPIESVMRDKDGAYVLLDQNANVKEPVIARLKLGISDDKFIEVVSGVTEQDRIIVKSKKYSLPKDTMGTNPFMPSRKR
jgi:macrolide-specific efflux system membrane fusion protein